MQLTMERSRRDLLEVWEKAWVKVKNTYYGIGVAQEHTCGVGFILENEIHCGESKDIQDCCHFNP